MNTLFLVCAVLLSAVFVANAQSTPDCDQIFSTNLHDNDKHALCKIYQTSSVLVQLGATVIDSVEKFLVTQGHDVVGEQRLNFQKRKHEYLRFGRK
ncbi:AF2 peptide [Aphelenchoides fujianensis]|nr:AF2 peptide [Aphelenchoides fujianensis]